MRLFTLFLLAALAVTSLDAASYQKTDGTIVDPIQSVSGGNHVYDSYNLQPYADLWRANLTNATLADATLGNARLTGADLSGAYLTGVDLSGADLGGADLTYADLTGANMWGADLTGTNLSYAELSESILYRANLSNANLSHANLTGADLTVATLTGANLTGADLSGAALHCWPMYTGNCSGMYSMPGSGVTSGGITGTPLHLPTDWQIAGGYLIGPAARHEACRPPTQWYRSPKGCLVR